MVVLVLVSVCSEYVLPDSCHPISEMHLLSSGCYLQTVSEVQLLESLGTVHDDMTPSTSDL